MKNLQLKACIHASGNAECALFETELPALGEDEVLIKVEAAPINPSDLGLMFGLLDTDTAIATERNGYAAVTVPVPAPMMKAFKARIDTWLPAGNEGAGLVVDAGSSEAAQQLIGKRVGCFGGEFFARYRVANVTQCLPLHEGISSEQGASCVVNPMTALGFVETAKREGHSAIIHAAAASNLGQMLNRICLEDGIPLVNIVRKSEQAELLREQGAQIVINSSASDFAEQLTAAVEQTGATVAFDPIGGGNLVNQILTAMEIAAQKRAPEWSRYGSEEHKQVYVYGMLDPAPTTLTRGYGFCWGVSGWLLSPYLKRFGMARTQELQRRVLANITTTFASHYSDKVPLEQALSLDAVKHYGRKATGQKTLIVMP